MSRFFVDLSLPEPNNKDELLEFLNSRYKELNKTGIDLHCNQKNCVKGGFGCVYYGTMDGKEIAYKVISNIDWLLFYREVETMILGYNSFSVKILGYTTNPYGIVMERMKFSLAEKLKNLNSTQKTIIAISVIHGLQHLHANNKIHFDIKPENILLDDNYFGYLTDFGSVRNVGTELACPSYTLCYLPPEVYLNRNKKSNRNTCVDIYAYGLVLLTLMSEIPMNESPYCKNLSANKKAGKIPDIPEDTPKNLARIIIQCTNKEPSKRPTADELLQEFVNYQIGYPGTDWDDVYLKLKSRVSFINKETKKVEISKVCANNDRIEIIKENVDENSLKDSPGMIFMESIYNALIKSNDMEIPESDLLNLYKLIEYLLENSPERAQMIQKYFIVPYLKTNNDDLMKLVIKITQLYVNDTADQILASPEAINTISSFRKTKFYEETAAIYSILIINIKDKKTKLTTLEEKVLTDTFALKHFLNEFSDIDNKWIFNSSYLKYVMEASQYPDIKAKQKGEIYYVSTNMILEDNSLFNDAQNRLNDFKDSKYPIDILLASYVLTKDNLLKMAQIAENPENSIAFAKSKHLENLLSKNIHKAAAVLLLSEIVSNIRGTQLEMKILEGDVFAYVITNALSGFDINEEKIKMIDSGIVILKKTVPFTQGIVDALDKADFFSALSHFIVRKLPDKNYEITRNSLMLVAKMAQFIVPNMEYFLDIIKVRIIDPMNRDSALKCLLMLIGGNERIKQNWNLQQTNTAKQITESIRESSLYKTILSIKEQDPDNILNNNVISIIN